MRASTPDASPTGSPADQTNPRPGHDRCPPILTRPTTQTNHDPAMTRLRHATRRWLHIISLAILGAVEFHLILPLAWPWVRSIDLLYSPLLIKITMLLATFLLFYLVLEPIRVRRGQWSTFAWHPPLWTAPLLACAFAARTDRPPVDIGSHTASLHWQQPDIILPIIGTFFLAMFVRQVLRSSPPKQSTEPCRTSVHDTTIAGLPSEGAHSPQPERRPLWRVGRSNRGHLTVPSCTRPTTTDASRDVRPPSTWSWSQIHDWISANEQPITTDRQDLFGRAPVATRITEALQEGRSVALLGTFGTGKSSILNLALAKLRQYSTRTIVARLDVWAVPRPEDAPRVALDQIVDALDHHVDTVSLRGLPITYQRLVAALPIGSISRVLGLQTPGDSLAELQRLAPVLEVLNARLVLIVEDVERTTREFDTRHLQRFLWALRGIRRVSFVLACDPGNGPSIDFSKLCDTIELLRPMEYEHVGSILVTAVDHWRYAYPDIDPRPAPHRTTLRLEAYPSASSMHEYLRRLAPDTPLDQLVRLLQTPRRLRQVLRRVDLVWRRLHGEADLEHIVILTALREASTAVYEFLFAHIDAARHGPDEWLTPGAALTEQWNRLLESLSNGLVARQLVNLLGIQQLSDGGHQGVGPSPQGVHLSHPTDYFRRIATERLDPDELRDQTVLDDIDTWRQNRGGALMDSLLAADEESDRYPRVWLHFSGRHATTELTELTTLLVERVLDRDGREAEADHPALVALSDTCGRRLQRDRESGWLRALIVGAVPVALGFATELYRDWTGDDGIVTPGVRPEIRDALVEAVQGTLRDGTDVALLLNPRDPWSVGRFVLCMAEGGSGVDLETWREYLAPALARAARTHPEIVLPELANFLGDEESSRRGVGSGPTEFVGRYAIERDRAEAVLGDSLDLVLELIAEYEGGSVYVVRAREAASVWLQERRRQDR